MKNETKTTKSIACKDNIMGITIDVIENVKTPSNVKEFRENLGKCFWTLGGLGDELYVKPKGQDARFIPIKDISSFGDIYGLTGTGLFGDGTSPSILPKVKGYLPMTDSYDWFYLDQENQVDNIWDTPKWITLDNKMYRGLWIEVLGSFSGYQWATKKMVA